MKFTDSIPEKTVPLKLNITNNWNKEPKTIKLDMKIKNVHNNITLNPNANNSLDLSIIEGDKNSKRNF